MNPYPPGSRYHGIATATHTSADGREVAYLRRRLLPDPDRLVERARHEVHAGERLDHLAAAHHGDPLAWWLLADANVAAEPAELVAEAGRRLRIVLPPGAGGGL